MRYREKFSLEEFLQEREDRVERQLEILKKYGNSLLVVRSNYPGMDKNQYPANEIVEIIAQEIEKILYKKILYRDKRETLEGKIFTVSVDMELVELKKKMIYLEENHILGRFVDIDVYGEMGRSISRRDIGYNPRKCYLCETAAVICTRDMTHDHREIKRYILKGYEGYLEFEKRQLEIGEKLGDIALKSCIMEVSCHPSFGLVSPVSRGSHEDMDYFTFLESSLAIKDGLKKMATLGYSSMEREDIFSLSRNIGIMAEKKMFSATEGVNTHKGMIFLLGVVLQVVGKAFYLLRSEREKISEERFYNLIQEGIIEVSKNILADFENIPDKNRRGEKLTNGELLYLKHGFLGIRGQVKEGLSVVFQKGIPTLKDSIERGEGLNLALVKTLLKLMSLVEDSTIVNRKGIETLRKVQKDAHELSENFNLERAWNLEKEYIEKRISPGGSADLLAVTLVIYESYKLFKEL